MIGWLIGLHKSKEVARCLPGLAMQMDYAELAEKCLAGYDRIAEKYYCPDKHPTCANFAELHGKVLGLIQPYVKSAGQYLEIGCGHGRLDRITSNASVLLTDLSEKMISLARTRTGGRVACRTMNAFSPDLPECRFSGVAAFLADAYNHPAFYQASRRLIEPGGFLAITLPNHIWASALRTRLNFRLNETVFIVQGQTISVPSITSPGEDQIAMLSRFGFEVQQFVTMSLSVLSQLKPSHHVCFAAEELGLEPTKVPLLDFFIALRH